MLSIFVDIVEDSIEVFTSYFLAVGMSFELCLEHLIKVLERCMETKLVLNWEKFYFMVMKGIVLGHKIIWNKIQVDQVKVEMIAKLRPIFL